MSEPNFTPTAGDNASPIRQATVPAPGIAALGNARVRVGRRLRQQRLRLHRARLRFHDQRFRLFRFC